MPLPNQLPKLKFEGVDDTFQKWLDQLADAVNTHSGYLGNNKVTGHLDLNGFQIKNLGAPTEETDALSSAVAKASYSAPVLKAQLEAGGSSPLSTYRQLGSKSQRDSVSSYLNDLMSSVPNANQILPTFQNVGGGIQVSIPAAPFQFADGYQVLLQARTDILSLPTTFPISSISVTANQVTVNLGSPTGIMIGGSFTIVGVTPVQFNGSFVANNSSGGGTTIGYQDNIGTGTGSGGSLDLNDTYYYYVRKRSTLVQLFGPVSGDTAANRLKVSQDGNQIVAVVVLTATGGQDGASGGGGTPITGSPTAGVFF